MTILATLNLNITVTPTNYATVFEGVKRLFDAGAVFSADVTEPVETTEPAPAPNGAAPKAGRRASRKPAEEAPAATPEPPPVDVPQPELAEAVSEVWEEPAPAAAADAPLTMEHMTDKLNAFAKIHGVAGTRKTIQSFGVTRLSELDQSRWPELLARLKAENGGKPI